MTNPELFARIDAILDNLPVREKLVTMTAGCAGIVALHRTGSEADMTAAMFRTRDELKDATTEEVHARLKVEMTAAEKEIAQQEETH